MLASAFSYFKFAVMIFVMMGDSILGYLNIAVPTWYEQVKEKRWLLSIGCFFIGNMISQNLLSTGAFEIYLDDVEVFSKLKTGRMPE
jgi:selT/selW/selH-like putative selenoprotein